MANPQIRLPSNLSRTDRASKAKIGKRCPISTSSENPQTISDFSEILPCVLYECNSSLQVTFMSHNANDLIGVRPVGLIGTRALWDQRILREDLALISDKLNELERTGSASAIHRILDDRGLPVWIAHSLLRVQLNATEMFRGCIIPVQGEKGVQNLDRAIISRFVHKIGNHFQLLNLVINSLRKNLPDSRETEVLQQTIEKAIELTRTFSDYSQSPTWMSEVDLFEILNAAIVARKTSFARKGIEFERRLDESVRGMTIQGDPFLLELAIGGVLQNSLEATETGGTVVINAKVEACGNNASIARLRITDTGCGIRDDDLDKVRVPFFTSKKNHDGLGLSMAARIIEMHGGVLEIDSAEGKGTEIDITLPTEIAGRYTDR